MKPIKGGGYVLYSFGNNVSIVDVEIAVALSYSPQIRDEAVPVDATDVNIDALVSSNGILTFSSQAEEQINSS